MTLSTFLALPCSSNVCTHIYFIYPEAFVAKKREIYSPYLYYITCCNYSVYTYDTVRHKIKITPVSL